MKQRCVTAVAQLVSWDVEAIAVCLMWSVANPVHEQRIREIVNEEAPGTEVVLSSEVNPCIREYRRWVSAAMDASLKRLIATYCRQRQQSRSRSSAIEARSACSTPAAAWARPRS